jgi:hypothetical protein
MPRIDYIDDSEKTPQIAAMMESAKKTVRRIRVS